MKDFIIKKAGHSIAGVEDWFAHAPPEGGAEIWQSGKEEFELAKSFMSGNDAPVVPEELGQLLQSNPALGTIRLVQAIPAYQVKLDAQTGGSQRCDLMATGQSREGRTAAVIMAWSDGGFGPLIADQLKRSRPGSQWVQRIDRLCEAITGRRAAQCGKLRGGLIHHAAAALRVAEGEKAAVALLVFYEFRAKTLRGQQRKSNLSDLDALASALGGQPLREGMLSGPFRVPGGSEIPASVPLFLGKITRLLPA